MSALPPGLAAALRLMVRLRVATLADDAVAVD